MVNHPNRSQKSIDATIRRLLAKHSLARIEILVTRDGVVMRALPDAFNPAVEKRRQAAFANKESWSLSEARAISEDSMGPVAVAHALSSDLAIQALASQLMRA